MEPQKIKVTLSLSREALMMLDALTTERKRGEFVSGLISGAYQAFQQPELRLTPSDLAKQLRFLAERLMRLGSI